MGWLRWTLLAAAGAACLAAQDKLPASVLNDRGIAASARGDYAEAKKVLTESVRLWESMGPEFEGHKAVVMVNLAEAHCGEGHWQEGANLLSEALEISRRVLGKTHMRTAANMNFLASADLVLGEYSSAEALFNEALSVEREHFPGTTQLADTLMGISSLMVRTERLDSALAPAEEGLKVSLQAGGENTLDAAMAYANVAQVHVFSHRIARALPLFHKAEAIYVALFSPTHPRYASVLSQEGLALMEDGKLSQASRNMERAVEILEACSGCQYQEAVARSNLGWLRYQQGKYGAADTLLSQALSLQEGYSKRPSSEMATTLDRLSLVRRKERRFGDADQLHQRATKLYTYR